MGDSDHRAPFEQSEQSEKEDTSSSSDDDDDDDDGSSTTSMSSSSSDDDGMLKVILRFVQIILLAANTHLHYSLISDLLYQTYLVARLQLYCYHRARHISY